MFGKGMSLQCFFVFLQGFLKGFLEALGRLQKKFYFKGLRLECSIRIYLVTVRSVVSFGVRVFKILRSWGLETDEVLFFAGVFKGFFFEKIRLYIFFDDQMFYVVGVQEMGIVVVYVFYGVVQIFRRIVFLNEVLFVQQLSFQFY